MSPTAQSESLCPRGLFTIHNELRKPFASTKLQELTIPASAKGEFKQTFYKYGVSQDPFSRFWTKSQQNYFEYITGPTEPPA